MKQVDEEDVTVGGASGVTLPDATAVLNAEEYASSAAAAAPQEDNEGPSDAEIELPPGTGFPWGTGLPLEVCQSLSYWLQQVRIDPLLDHRSTAELPPDTDTVIIGSGMTGTLVAKHHLETFPNKKVVVLEARQFCSGATGRNAGHCKPDQWRHYEKFAKAYGHDQAVKIMENEQLTWKALVEYVQENNVDCDLWVGDTMDVPVDEEVARIAKEVFDRYKAAGGKVDHIKVTQDPAEAARISRIKSAKACYAWQASTLQPWKLTAHIMRENIKNGVNLQTGTLVKSISSGTGPRKWRVHTKRGDIDCDTIVHATNAYSAALEPSLRGIITPKPHLCNRAIPPQGLSGSKAIQNSYGILLPYGAIITINPRSTTDGTMLFGGSSPGQQEFDGWVEHNPAHGTDDSFGNIQFVTAPMKRFAEAEFEGWNDPPAGPGEGFDYSWSGIIGLSADGVPFIGQVPEKPGQWICAGHHGHGMARIFTAAPALVKLMRGAEWSDTGLPDVYRMTPERLRRLASRESAPAIAVI